MTTKELGPATSEIRWNEVVDYDRAVRLTGWSSRDIDGMTTAQLESRAAGAWQANEREKHVGYRSILAHREKIRRGTY